MVVPQGGRDQGIQPDDDECNPARRRDRVDLNKVTTKLWKHACAACEAYSVGCCRISGNTGRRGRGKSGRGGSISRDQPLMMDTRGTVGYQTDGLVQKRESSGGAVERDRRQETQAT